MFENEPGKAGVIFNETDGLWGVHRSTPQYWAWKYWLEDEGLHLRSREPQSKWLTVWSEWPPQTMAAAAAIAKRISDIRDAERNPKPVPRRPQAWDGIKPVVPGEWRSEVPK